MDFPFQPASRHALSGALALLLLAAFGGSSRGDDGGSGTGGGTQPPSPAPRWAAPVAIDAGTDDALNPQLAMDDAGNALALWMENDSASPNRYYARSNRYVASTGWGTPEPVEPVTALTSGRTFDPPSAPSLAMNGAGQNRAVWEQWVDFFDSGTYLYGIWTNVRFAGGWGVPQRVENPSGPGVHSVQPQVAINGSGVSALVWSRRNNAVNDAGLWAAVAGQGRVVAVTAADVVVTGPRLTLDADGNAILLWRAARSGGGAGQAVWSSQFDVRPRSWNAPAVLPTLSGDALSAQLAGNAAGLNIAVVAIDAGGGRTDLHAARFITRPSAIMGRIGTWVYETLLQAGGTQPQVAVDASGNALAVWVQVAPNTLERSIWARYSAANTSTWGSAQRVDDANGFGAATPQIGFGPTGEAIAVWSEFDAINDSNGRIWANEYTPGTGWGAPAAIETGTGYFSTDPQIRIDANGNVLAVWTRTEGGRTRVWAAVGPQFTGLFRDGFE